MKTTLIACSFVLLFFLLDTQGQDLRFGFASDYSNSPKNNPQNFPSKTAQNNKSPKGFYPDWKVFSPFSGTKVAAGNTYCFWVGSNGGLSRVSKYGGVQYFDKTNSLLEVMFINNIKCKGNYLWISNNGKLFKVDHWGNNWQAYSSPNSIKTFEHFIPDNTGNVYVYRKGNGADADLLEKFNGSSWFLIDLTYLTNILGSNQINISDMEIDYGNNLWVTHENGSFSKYNGSNWINYCNAYPNICFEEILGVKCDAFGYLWFVNESWTNSCTSLIKFNPANNTYNEYTNNLSFGCEDFDIDLSTNIKYISTHYQGVYYFDDYNWGNLNSTSGTLTTNWINSITYDNTNSMMLFCNWEDVVDVYGNGYIPYDHYNFSNTPIKAYGGGIVKTDVNNNVWFGNSIELYKYDGNNWYVFNQDTFNIPSNCYLRDIAIENYNTIWSVWGGTPSELIKLNPDGTFVKFDENNSNCPTYLQNIHVDRKGTKWILSGAYDNSRLTSFNDSIFFTFTTSNSNIPKDTVLCISEDSNGNIWCGSKNCIVKFDGINWEIFNLDTLNLNDSDIRFIEIDKNDIVWATTWWSSYILKYDGSNWIKFESPNCPVNGITDLYVDTYNRIWTLGANVCCYDGNQWMEFNESNSGFPGVVIGGSEINVDASGYYYFMEGWISRYKNTDFPCPKIYNSKSVLLKPGDSVILKTYSIYNSFQWSNGITNCDSIIVTESGYYDVTVTDQNGNTATSYPIRIYKEPSGIELDLRVFLEGPFLATEMISWLNGFGYLPIDQPYNIGPWCYFGYESVSSIPNANVVDWVLVELRHTTGDASTATNDSTVARQAGFLLKDGSIVGLDGYSMMQFDSITVTSDLYAVIRHRNHLNIMSSNPLQPSGRTYSWDFSNGTDKVYGGNNGHKQVGTEIWGMISGDGDANGNINNTDKIDVWKPQSGNSGYLIGDFNLNSQVDNTDKIGYWKPNSGRSTQVPIGSVNTPPVAVIQMNPPTGSTNTIFTLDASESYDNQSKSTLLAVRWDFENDGTWDTPYSYNKTTTHQYVIAGEYIIKLEVIDIGGLTGTQTYSLTVSQSYGEPCPGIPTVAYEGQVYNTLQIGTQCWLKENLNVGSMINGSQNQTNNQVIEKYCYNNDPVNCVTYGGLYQWDEMMQYVTTPGAKGICPVGWHVPTDAEWCTITKYIDPTVDCNSNGWSGTDGGTRMKSTTGWYGGGNGTNTSGFTANPGGLRTSWGDFNYQGLHAYFWSSTVSGSYRWYWELYYYYSNIYRSYYPANYGYSVRCLKD